MINEVIEITFENGETLRGELVSWSKEINKNEEVIQYNFSIKL